MVRYIQAPKDVLPNYIKNRVRRSNKNFLALCTGSPGSGKSYAMMALAEQCDPTFNIDRVVLTIKEMMKLITSGKIKKGNAFIPDEFGVMHNSRAFQSTDNRIINFLIQTFRRQRFIMLGCAPSLGLIDKATRNLLHCHFETCGIDKTNNTSQLKPFMLQASQRQDKVYTKYLRIQGEFSNKKMVQYTRLELPLPSKELIAAYEEKRDRFQEKINKEIETKLEHQELKENKLKDKETTSRLSKSQEGILLDWIKGFTIKQCAENRNMPEGTVKSHRYTLNMMGLNPKSQT